MKHVIQSSFDAFRNTNSLITDAQIVGVSMFQFTPQFEPQVDQSVQISTFKAKKLGYRAEEFFECMIDRHPEYKLLTSNLQIISNGQTLGELDYIVEHLTTGEVLHIELAYKIYLYLPKIDDSNKAWIGPNRRDSLYRKLKKLREHQFPLLYRKATLPYLDALGLTAADLSQKLFLPGMLFLPFDQKRPENTLVNNENIVGFYFRIPQLKAYLPPNVEGFVPDKIDWMMNLKDQDTWLPISSIIAQIEGHLQMKNSPMVWLKHPDGSLERLFVIWW